MYRLAIQTHHIDLEKIMVGEFNIGKTFKVTGIPSPSKLMIENATIEFNLNIADFLCIDDEKDFTSI